MRSLCAAMILALLAFQDKGQAKDKDIAAKALQLLAQNQRADGQWDATNDGEIVTTTWAALAFLAGGSTTEAGPYKDNVDKAAKAILDWIQKGCQDLRPGWCLPFATLLVGELNRLKPTPALKEALKTLASAIEKEQWENGGWSHARAIREYGSFVAPTCWNLIALGYLKRARMDIPIPDAVLSRGADYVERCILDDGSMPYMLNGDTHNGSRYSSLGQGSATRTLLAWLALSAIDAKPQVRKKLSDRLDRYGFPLVGKLDPEDKGNEYAHWGMEPLTYLAWAIGSWNRGVGKQCLDTQRPEIVARFQRDGTFSPDAAVMDTQGLEASGGRNWASAAYAIVLQLPQQKLRLGQFLKTRK